MTSTEPQLLHTLRGAGHFSGVDWSPDGREIVGAQFQPGALIVWESGSGRELYKYNCPDVAMAVAWSPDGAMLANGGFGGGVWVWDAHGGGLLHKLSGHSEEEYRDLVNDVDWHPRSKLLASCGSDGTVRVWDAIEGRGPWTRMAHDGEGSGAWYGGGVMAVAWSPDGAKLASAGKDAKVKVWDTKSLDLFHTFKVCRKGELASGVTWSPDGAKLASCGSQNPVTVWDVLQEKRLKTLNGHEGGVAAVAWSPDGTKLASVGQVIPRLIGDPIVPTDLTVKVWDAVSGSLRYILNNNRSDDDLSGYVAWSPDGVKLASVGGDDSIMIWSIPK